MERLTDKEIENIIDFKGHNEQYNITSCGHCCD